MTVHPAKPWSSHSPECSLSGNTAYAVSVHNCKNMVFIFLLGIDEKLGHVWPHRAKGSFIIPHLVTVKWFRTLTAPQVIPPIWICPLRHMCINQDAGGAGTQSSPQHIPCFTTDTQRVRVLRRWPGNLSKNRRSVMKGSSWNTALWSLFGQTMLLSANRARWNLDMGFNHVIPGPGRKGSLLTGGENFHQAMGLGRGWTCLFLPAWMDTAHVGVSADEMGLPWILFRGPAVTLAM